MKSCEALQVLNSHSNPAPTLSSVKTIFVFIFLAAEATALQVPEQVTRRHWFEAGAALGAALAPAAANAETSFLSVSPGFHEIRDDEVVEAQQFRGEKVDMNNAGIVEYKEFPGMYPRVAGIVCSHGPYKNVKQFYSIPGLTARDKTVFKKYETSFTALPPGRGFIERLNARQSL